MLEGLRSSLPTRGQVADAISTTTRLAIGGTLASATAVLSRGRGPSADEFDWQVRHIGVGFAEMLQKFVVEPVSARLGVQPKEGLAYDSVTVLCGLFAAATLAPPAYSAVKATARCAARCLGGKTDVSETTSIAAGSGASKSTDTADEKKTKKGFAKANGDESDVDSDKLGKEEKAKSGEAAGGKGSESESPVAGPKERRGSQESKSEDGSASVTEGGEGREAAGSTGVAEEEEGSDHKAQGKSGSLGTRQAGPEVYKGPFEEMKKLRDGKQDAGAGTDGKKGDLGASVVGGPKEEGSDHEVVEKEPPLERQAGSKSSQGRASSDGQAEFTTEVQQPPLQDIEDTTGPATSKGKKPEATASGSSGSSADVVGKGKKKKGRTWGFGSKTKASEQTAEEETKKKIDGKQPATNVGLKRAGSV